MSEENKNIELNDEELDKITGGSGEGNYKYNVGSIFYEDKGNSMFHYYVITNYKTISSSKPYLCDVYLIDAICKSGYKSQSNLSFSQSQIDSYHPASYIPYVS